MTTSSPTLRAYDIAARSTDVFGRVLLSARNHHFVIDGPVQNNCPGEAITPAEAFLSGVAGCAVELIHVLAQNDNVPLSRVAVTIHGEVDRERQKRPNVVTFNLVEIDVTLWGVSAPQAATLVQGFQARCPLYGTVSIAADETRVRHSVGK